MRNTAPQSALIKGVFIGLFALLSSARPAMAKQFDRGQALYENHCTSCHDEAVHKRKDHRASSINDLHKWVMAWSFHAQLGWSGEDIDDVVDFLNVHYYRFTDKP